MLLETAILAQRLHLEETKTFLNNTVPKLLLTLRDEGSVLLAVDIS